MATAVKQDGMSQVSEDYHRCHERSMSPHGIMTVHMHSVFASLHDSGSRGRCRFPITNKISTLLSRTRAGHSHHPSAGGWHACGDHCRSHQALSPTRVPSPAAPLASPSAAGCIIYGLPYIIRNAIYHMECHIKYGIPYIIWSSI